MLFRSRTPYHPSNSIIANFLFSTRSARTLAIAAYAAGGKVELISERDRTAIRVTGPQWARAGIDCSIVQFLNETPQTDPVALRHAIAEADRVPQPGFRESVEKDIERRVLGLQDAPTVSEGSLQELFSSNFGLDRAFVLATGAPLNALKDLPARKSTATPRVFQTAGTGRGNLHYTPDAPTGSVIVAAPLQSIYFESWYSALVLDRLIRQVIPQVQTFLEPSIGAYYYRLEVPVPEGQFDDAVTEWLLGELDRIYVSAPSASGLESAKRSAMEYLESPKVVLWFQTLGVEAHRLEGMEYIRSITNDEVRAAARDLFMDPVIAGWSPKEIGRAHV